MTVRSIIQGGRGAGKTYRMMSEIHSLLISGRRPDVLVIFPEMRYVHWWIREWQDRFPQVPPPDYMTIGNMPFRIRGRKVARVFVEDVDSIPDGIYNPAFLDLYPAMASFDDSEITFTSNWILENLTAHRAKHTSRSVLRRLAVQMRIDD